MNASPAPVLDLFSAPVGAWFADNFDAPTPVQERGWPLIAGGDNVLLVAPTGSGKTLAAFLWGIDRLSRAGPQATPGVGVLYVSPLKALVHDVERNLRAPLAGIRLSAARLGVTAASLSVDVRTGDTPQRERERQRRAPAPLLVTTPESLFLMLGSRTRDGLRTVHTVIVDEIHALAPGKRGVHLALSLERLAALTGGEPQRIGLSATVRPAARVASFLGGDRAVAVVDAGEPPRLDLRVTVPVPDMQQVAASQPPPERSGAILGELYAREVGTPASERGIWPAIYPRLLEEIARHRSTIVFVNSRGLCERLAQRLNELAGEELVRAHHGSVSHEQRAEMEEALKDGRLRAIVATSSLELGIDMGAVDRVVLMESPGSVARGLQRIGRAGHQVGAVSAGSIYPKFRGDLLECAVIAGRMLSGRIEALRIPENALDVLAQQLVAMCCDAPRQPEALHALVRRSWPYRDLSLDALLGVLEMLSGKYPSAEFADLRPRLNWDRAENVLSARRGTAMVSRMNAGTIPDRGNFPVHLGADGPRVGELDEEMVFEARTGENILLGASTWCIQEIGRDRVVVSPAPGEPGKLPFWRGDGPGRPLELGEALGAFVREVGAMEEDAAARHLCASLPLDAFAARNLAAYVHEQRRHTGTLPTDRDITVERFRDELGDWRVCILTPFGAPVHGPWAMALQRELESRAGFEVQLMYTDDGIVVRFADADELPGLESLIPDPDRLADRVTEQLADTALFAGLFRENAVRALLLTRRRPGTRMPLFAQRQRAQSLLASVRRYPSFPVVLETFRQALSDVFDLAGTRRLLERIRSREVRVHEVETASASPFARSLVFAYVAAYIYEQDAPLAERRAQALTLDRALLEELLGQTELRELIDAQVLATLESELQHLDGERAAGDTDGVHDLLRRLGDLDAEELRERSSGDPAPWLAELERTRRALPMVIGGRTRWIAVEDVALYRDALGCMPPGGLPERLLAPVDDAITTLVARYARTHGPFPTATLAARYRLPLAEAQSVLARLEAAGALVHGEIRPAGSLPEWCDKEVFARLKRRTLAKLRNQVAAVDAATYARFLAGWHRLDDPRGGADALEEALLQLEGVPLSFSALMSHVLPARVRGFRPEMLDMLAATGRIAWVGRAALGPADGRIAMYRRRHAGRLLPPPASDPGSLAPLPAAMLRHLDVHGASFTMELTDAARAACPHASDREITDALWDLVWGGLVTNDTFQPLSALAARTARRRAAGISGGRWSRVPTAAGDAEGATERLLASAQMLLERYGVVSREAVASEGLRGGFGPVYRVLRAMEDAGRVRRGYFVEGLGSAQFATAGAVDRLRAARLDDDDDPDREPVLAILAAADPANPYGTVLPWPATGGGDRVRPRRVPGAWLVLVDGRPALYVAASGRHLLTFEEQAPEGGRVLGLALSALPRLPRARRHALLVVEKVNGEPVTASSLGPLLQAHGFVRDYRGMTLAPEARPGVQGAADARG